MIIAPLANAWRMPGEHGACMEDVVDWDDAARTWYYLLRPALSTCKLSLSLSLSPPSPLSSSCTTP
jgi:hypothetical protein